MVQATIQSTSEKDTRFAPSEPESSIPTAPNLRRKIIYFGVPVLVFLVGLLAWKIFLSGRTPSSIVTLSGRIEGDDSSVACKTSGRILEIRVREGDVVKAGDLIAVLDDQQVRARQDQAKGAALSAEAREQAAREQIAILEQQLEQSQLQTRQAAVDAEGRVRQAEADLAAAEAELAQQEAAYEIASFDRDAYTRLAKTGAVSERQGKQAFATAAQQAAAVAAGKRRVEAARGALTTAQANLDNARIRGTQAAMVVKQIAQQRAEIASATANAQQARAQVMEADANLRDLTVKAPFDGTVMTRAAEPGEVVQAGTAIVTLLDLSKVYLRGFIPESSIGRIRIGQPARVYLDSSPKAPLEAEVVRIDPAATFTPENTYFQEDRVKQVIGVKVQLKAGIGFAKPGMPCDGEILTQGAIWPNGGRNR